MSVRFLRNAGSNFLAGALPALLSLATVPFIVKGLGVEGYGLFTLITAIVGYFALIDINVTAGSVKHLAHYHSLGRVGDASEVIVFGGLTYLGIGAIGCIAIYFFAATLASSVFNVPPKLALTAEQSLRIAAFGFLFGQMQAYLGSLPQALMRYDISGRIELGFGLLVPLATVALLISGYGLIEVVAVRVALSICNCIVLLWALRKLVPWFTWRIPGKAVMVQVGSFSGYAFLSRIAALSYAHLDKLIIGGVVGLSALSYYAVAATLGNRVLALMFRISAVMFPAASTLAAKGHESQLRDLYLRLSRYVPFLNACMLLLLAAFAEPLLYYWMGADFAKNGALVLQLVACAQFIDSLTNIPSLVNDGMGHPKVTGLFAVSRAIIGLMAVYAFVHLGGIQGVALAHLVSAVLVTTAFIVYVHGRTVPCTLRDLLSKAYWPAIPVVAVVGGVAVWWVGRAGVVLSELWPALVALPVFLGLLGYTVVLLPADRIRLIGMLKLTGVKRGS